MHDNLHSRVENDFPKGTDVADGKRIDHRQPLTSRHLNQAEDRFKGFFADKFGVKGEAGALPQMIDEPFQLGWRRDDRFGSFGSGQYQFSRVFKNRRMAALASDGFS